MIIFITGGVKGGKSMFAQYCTKLLHAQDEKSKLIYFATMIPADSEDLKRVDRHIKDRAGWGYETIEEGKDVEKVFSSFKGNEIVLFDSITAIVQNNIFDIDKINYEFDATHFSDSLLKLSEKVKHLVLVSDYIFSDALIYDDLTDLFREKLAQVHINVAGFSDVVLECAFSNMKVWKNTVSFSIDDIKSEYYKNHNHLKYSDI